jgi:endoglucanase
MKRRFSVLWLCILALLSNDIIAADIIYLSPIKGDILLLHFREGEKNTSECEDFNLNGCDNIWYSGILDQTLARITSSYTISSTDDTNYSSALNPSIISYKAKKEAGFMSYWVYLELPSDLKEGSSYTITFTGLASNKNSETIIFNTKNLRSESVHVNQIGYVPNANLKYAYVYQWMGTEGGVDYTTLEGNNYYLVRHSDSAVVYASADYGKGLSLRSDIELEQSGSSRLGWNGTAIWECDLSDICNTVIVSPDEYRIAIDGIGCSFPFKIDKDIYTELSYLLTRGLYHQRSGPARTIDYTPFVKPIDHTPGVNGFKVSYSNHPFENDDHVNFEQLPAQATAWVWPDNPHPHMADEADGWGWGGYFDAADCDRNRKHMQVSTDLLLIYEMNPEKYSDGELNIPESGNGFADIIDEATWGIDVFRRLKGPTGGICGGMETTGYYHPSWEDDHMWYAYAEEAIASWNFSGLAAHLAYCLEIAGAEEVAINDWIQEAKDAYTWAELESPGNEDREHIEHKYYAAACLYRATGEQVYLDDFIECRTWYNDLNANNGTYVYCLTPSDRWPGFTADNKTLQNNLKSTIEEMAFSEGLDQANARALRFIKKQNAGIAWGRYYPKVMLQMVHHHFSENDDVLDLLFTTADLYLGVNSDQQVFISGAEEYNADRLFRDMLNLDSHFDGVPGWIPGIPPYKHSASYYDASHYIEPSDPNDWPLMEQCIDARYYIPAGEYTIQETVSPLTTLFSYLKAYSSSKQISIYVESPKEDSVFVPGADVPVLVSASTLEGSVTKVELYSGSDKIGEDVTSPYEFTLESLPAGIYMLSAKAFVDGESKKSKAVRIILDDQHPSEPENLVATSTERLKIGISWDAAIDNVEVQEYMIYVDGALWTTSYYPYCTLEGLNAANTYSIYVTAIDYAGLESASSNVIEAATESSHTIPGRIEAEHFDVVLGEVGIDDARDTDNTDYVGWFDYEEELTYAINVTTANAYLATARVARGMDESDFELLVNEEVQATLTVPNTGGWIAWIDTTTIINMEAGEQTLTIKNIGNPFNINWIEFETAIETSGITIDNCPLDSIEVGTSYDLTATVSPAEASIKNTLWESDNELVAIVDGLGTVSALSPGVADIVAKTEFGDYSYSCEVTVFEDKSSVHQHISPGFTMYPNPFEEGLLTMKGDVLNNAIISITDLNGRIVIQENSGPGNGEYSLQIDGLLHGIFIVNVVSSETKSTEMLIIK